MDFTTAIAWSTQRLPRSTTCLCVGTPCGVDERNRFGVFDGNGAHTIYLLEAWRTLPNWTIIVSWYVTQDQSSPARRQEIEPEK
jgi:hypothetical protein